MTSNESTFSGFVKFLVYLDLIWVEFGRQMESPYHEIWSVESRAEERVGFLSNNYGEGAISQFREF